MLFSDQPKWPLFFIALFPTLLFGIFAYKNFLPYQFPNQWQPTASTLNTTGVYDDKNEQGVFMGKKVASSPVVKKVVEKQAVLGDYYAVKRIDVDLTNQRVYAFEDNKKVMEFVVSTGKWGRTPTGTFRIAYKNYVQKMEGGNKALGTYYYLPNVHYVQFFGNEQIPWSRGFSFHEAYWHNNFGVPMSHGCINMKLEDAQALYEWTTPDTGGKWWAKATGENLGTVVMIYGQTPAS